MENKELREKLALAAKILVKQGHGDWVLGHVSARLEGTETYLMKPRGIGIEEVTPEEFIVVDYDGNKISGNKECHNEYPIHSEIFRAREDVNCIIHTHPFHATVFASLRQPIRPITHEGALFSTGTVFFEETTDLIVSREQGEAVANCLGAGHTVLMRNHGVVVVGESIEKATVTAVYLEKAATAQLMAMMAGTPTWTDHEEVEAKRNRIFSPYLFQKVWDYLVRNL